MAWPKLEAPPINEVVCGVFFTPQPAIDPLFIGGWSRDIEDDYPRHAIQPAVVDGPGLLMTRAGPPLRSWLIAKDDQWVIQVQPDRFYVNWRRRGGVYPRFSGSGGVLERALEEFKRFQKYCAPRLKGELMLSTVELAKVDLIVEGPAPLGHWRDPEDLGKLVPVVGDVTRFAKSKTVELGLNIVEQDLARRSTRVVALSLSTEVVYDGRIARALKIDTRCSAPLERSDLSLLQPGFTELNDRANATFFGLVNNGELGRFAKLG